MNYEDILRKFSDYFDKSVLWMDILRTLGFGIAKFLYTLCNLVIKLFDDMFKLLDFTNYGKVSEFINSFKPVFIILLAFSLAALFANMLINHEKKPKLLKNMLVSLAVISSSTILINMFNEVIISGKNAIGAADVEVSASMINGSMVDLLYIDRVNQLTDFTEKYPSVDDTLIDSIDVTAKVDKDTEGISDTGKEVFNHYMDVDGDGKVQYFEFKKGWLSFTDPPYYYRYSIDFLTLYISFIAIIIAYFCSAYKVARIIYEIVVHQLLAYLFASDMNGGQKLIKVLDSLKNSYIVLILVCALLRIFAFANQFVNTLEISEFSKVFLLLFLAFAVIDGPNIVERISGVDAGLKSGFGKIMAGVTLGRMAASGTRAALFGNPMRNTKGLLNNKYTKAAGGLGKEAFGMAGDISKAGVGFGAGYLANSLKSGNPISGKGSGEPSAAGSIISKSNGHDENLNQSESSGIQDSFGEQNREAINEDIKTDNNSTPIKEDMSKQNLSRASGESELDQNINSPNSDLTTNKTDGKKKNAQNKEALMSGGQSRPERKLRSDSLVKEEEGAFNNLSGMSVSGGEMQSSEGGILFKSPQNQNFDEESSLNNTNSAGGADVKEESYLEKLLDERSDKMKENLEILGPRTKRSGKLVKYGYQRGRDKAKKNLGD